MVELIDESVHQLLFEVYVKFFSFNLYQMDQRHLQE